MSENCRSCGLVLSQQSNNFPLFLAQNPKFPYVYITHTTCANFSKKIWMTCQQIKPARDLDKKPIKPVFILTYLENRSLFLFKLCTKNVPYLVIYNIYSKYFVDFLITSEICAKKWLRSWIHTSNPVFLIFLRNQFSRQKFSYHLYFSLWNSLKTGLSRFVKKKSPIEIFDFLQSKACRLLSRAFSTSRCLSAQQVIFLMIKNLFIVCFL